MTVDVSLRLDFEEEHAVLMSEISTPNKETPETIHKRIKRGNEFFIEVDGDRTPLKPAENEGTLYVRSEKNDTEDDNLLNQEPC